MCNFITCFRETQSDELLEKARTMFSDHFSSAVNFQPSSLLIVTWDDVGYFDRKSDKVFTHKLPPGTHVAPDDRVFTSHPSLINNLGGAF